MRTVKKVLLIATLALAVAAVAGAMHATNWGPSFKVFGETCKAMGGTLHGWSYGATCSYEGSVTTVPARNPGWTVTVAEGSVATWLGGGKVTEKVSAGQIVVACHDQDGEALPLWQQQCARP